MQINRNIRSTRNHVDLKNLIAALVILASLLFTIGLVLVAKSRNTYWVATRSMTPGHMVDSLDFKAVKADFGAES